MEVQELRIGNLVTTVEGTKHFGKTLEIEFLTNNNCYDLDAPLDSINGYELKEVIPIPLTEEWLVRFGFERKTKIINERIYTKGSLGIFPDYGIVVYYVESAKDGSITIPVHMVHVHQLQNLYFALTGEELEFNDN